MTLGMGSACFFMAFYLLIHYQTISENVVHLSRVLQTEETDRITAQYALNLEHPLEETFRHVGESSALASYLSSDMKNRFFYLPNLESELLSAQSHYQGFVHRILVLDNQANLLTGLQGRKRIRQWKQLTWSADHPVHELILKRPNLSTPITWNWYKVGDSHRFFAVSPFKDPETQQQGGYLAVEADLDQFLQGLFAASPEKGLKIQLARPTGKPAGTPLTLALFNQQQFLELDLIDDFSHFKAQVHAEIVKQIALALVILVFYFLMLNLLTNKVIEPLYKLAKATREISAGNFDAPLKWSGIRETDELIKDFQSMKGQLGRTLISKEYVDKILASLSDAVFALKPTGEIERFNPAAVDILDPKDDLALLGLNLFDHLYPEDDYSRPLDHKKLLKLIYSDELKELKAQIQSFKGEKIPVIISGGGILDKTKNLSTIVLTVFDARESKILNELKDTHARMIHSERLAALGEFSGGIAHEINNPLAIISVLAQQLVDMAERGDVNQEKILAISQKIDATTMRIAQIVKGLRRIARDDNQDPFTMATVGELVDDTMGLVQEKLRNHFIEIKTEIECPTVSIECMPVQVSQILLILISNAVDALDGVTSPWIKVTAQDLGKHVEFCVVDCGVGIDPEARQKILQPFFTTKPIGQGTGLGLSIANSLVKDHHGHLRLIVDEALTTFSVKLPKQQPTEGEEYNEMTGEIRKVS